VLVEEVAIAAGVVVLDALVVFVVTCFIGGAIDLFKGLVVFVDAVVFVTIDVVFVDEVVFINVLVTGMIVDIFVEIVVLVDAVVFT